MTSDQRALPASISRSEWSAFAALAAFAVVLAAFAGRTAPALFTPYFGGIAPGAAVALGSIAGAGALWGMSRHPLITESPLRASGRALLLAGLLPLPFAALAIGIDLTLGFPRDINVALPWALAFYPVMAVFVESALHAAPFAVVLWTVYATTRAPRLAIAAAIMVPALIEPVLQAGYAGGLGENALATTVALHVFLIGLTQLALFWRYGFWAMLTFRLAYYVLWHVAWGGARLDLLF